jgi:CDP-diacylglycerol--serine O-phosphatidyltransferase
MRKIYLIPNLITSANLFCGFYSITSSIHSEFLTAAWLIVLAGVFDALDGRVARLAKASSAFGVEYDSMSDLVSFGMAPALLLYQSALEPMGRDGVLLGFYMVCCAALRLARFNVNTKVISKKFFQGLPSPIAAGSVATFFIFQNTAGWPTSDSFLKPEWVIMGLSVLIPTLMISNIPFYSFKEMNWRSKNSFLYLLAGVLTLAFIFSRSGIALFSLIILYLSICLIWNLSRLLKGAPSVFETHTSQTEVPHE